MGDAQMMTPFSDLLRSHGWSHAKTLFATFRRRFCQRSYARPYITGEQAVLIPYFVNANHRVAVARREAAGQVTFFYSDDLNSPRTESQVCQAFQNTPEDFYPPTVPVGYLSQHHIPTTF